MAVYEYLCPKCRSQFELMRPMSEAEKPTECPKCGSQAQKLISSFGSKSGDSIQPTGEPFNKRTVVGEVGFEISHVERRDMAQASLLQMLEDLGSKVRLLELEKRQAAARAQALERENSELIGLITLAAEKVDEILGIGANDEISQPQAVNVPAGSKGLEQLKDFSADKQRESEKRFHRVFRPE